MTKTINITLVAIYLALAVSLSVFIGYQSKSQEAAQHVKIERALAIKPIA